jgi:hypothetical protein
MTPPAPLDEFTDALMEGHGLSMDQARVAAEAICTRLAQQMRAGRLPATVLPPLDAADPDVEVITVQPAAPAEEAPQSPLYPHVTVVVPPAGVTGQGRHRRGGAGPALRRCQAA